MLRLPCRIISAAVVAATQICAQSHAANTVAEPRIEAVRFWSFGDVTRVAIATSGEYSLSSDYLEKPPRLFFDLKGLRPPASATRKTQVFRVGDRLVQQIRVAETEPGISRVVVDLEVPVDFTSSQLVNPDRLMIEIRPKGGVLPETLTARSHTGLRRISDLSPLAPRPEPDRAFRTVASPVAKLEIPPVPSADLFGTPAFRFDAEPDTRLPRSTLVWAGRPAVSKASPVESVSARTERAPDAAATEPLRMTPARIDESNRSLVRVFGLKIHRVVIDAGHGGHDTGTIGPKGLMEKDLVLDVALRLGRLVQQRIGAEVVYTRSTDVFIPLEQRTKIANDEKADLFISIHANSSPASSATGVETYYFNFTSDQRSLDLATRENASSNSSIFQLNDLLHKAVLNAKVEESREFAQRVQTSLYSMSAKMNSASRDRGVKKAPFVVLIGATMPSILAEVGFVSNQHDERLLRREDQRQRIAESLFKGLSGYATSLSHTQMARNK